MNFVEGEDLANAWLDAATPRRRDAVAASNQALARSSPSTKSAGLGCQTHLQGGCILEFYKLFGTFWNFINYLEFYY